MRRLLPLLFAPLLAACTPQDGTDVDNPDLVSRPERFALEGVCAGGRGRVALRLINRSGHGIDAVAGGSTGVEAHPSVFALEPYGERSIVAVIRLPDDAATRVKGEVQVQHRRMGATADSETLRIPWTAAVAAVRPAATVLCGAEIPCEAIEFGEIFAGATWQQPVEVANDGCAPLALEHIDVEGAFASIAGPELPSTLAPGERWHGRLLLRPEGAGRIEGNVVVATSDPERPTQRLPWRATVR